MFTHLPPYPSIRITPYASQVCTHVLYVRFMYVRYVCAFYVLHIGISHKNHAWGSLFRIEPSSPGSSLVVRGLSRYWRTQQACCGLT